MHDLNCVKASRSMLCNALRAAADQYYTDAKAMPENIRLVEMFTRQAQAARTLAEKVEQADRIDLND